MRAASYDRRSERLLAKQLVDNSVGDEDLSPSGSPAGNRFRSLVSPFERIRVLRSAIHRLGSINYLLQLRGTEQWKAVIGGRTYAGSFNEVIDQVAHLILHHVTA